MKNHLESHAIRRVMVGTDRSETADQAVHWAAGFADRYDAELFVVQVVVPQYPSTTEFGAAEQTRAAAANDDLTRFARQVAGERGHALVVLDADPAVAIVRAAEQEAIDVLVVGNFGMAGRKEFLLGNVPNRISHNARCTVIIVNTLRSTDAPASDSVRAHRPKGDIPSFEPRLVARATHIATVMAKHGLTELFGQSDEPDRAIRRQQAKRLRTALEELGPTFSKLGQVLSTRPDLLPVEYIEELALLQSHVPPMAESEVVRVSEQELGVPWEDVFKSIDPKPLAAGTIAQVHRATLESGDRVVVKVQRPTARAEIEQDLALLEVFAEKVGKRPALNQVIDMEAVFKHLSTSLHRELDFRQEADNIERMQGVLADYDRLAVPGVHRDLSTSRLLVMEEIQGIPIKQAPAGPERIQAARQLLESYYKQIIVDGFFHADPHPGNLMWWKDRIYFLDFGMVGVVGADFREHLLLLLMALWQEDAAFLTDVTLMMTGAIDRRRSGCAPVPKRDRGGDGEISHGRAGRDADRADSAGNERGLVTAWGPATGLAHARRQGTRAGATGDRRARSRHSTRIDVAGKFLTRSVVKRMGTALNPKTLVYQSQKFKVRALRVIEAVEHLIGARPGQKLVVNFRANSLEDMVRRTGRRLALGLTAAASVLASGLTVMSTGVAEWVPITFGIVAGLLTVGLVIDLLRGR